jgi:hypothetical protein
VKVCGGGETTVNYQLLTIEKAREMAQNTG